jgi:expansin (peptidoglycan-binding protein)
MNKQTWLRAIPWMVAGAWTGFGAGCGAEVDGSGDNTSPLPASGAAGAGRGGGGGASPSGGGAGLPSGGLAAGAAAGVAAKGGASGGSGGPTGGATTVQGGASAGGGVVGVGGTTGVSGAGTGGGCPVGQLDCNGICADVQTDAANCGACGKACPTDRPCLGGMCQCPSGTTKCGEDCVDVQTDQANCGMCGTACMAGTPCLAGNCTQGGMCMNDTQTYNGRITYYRLATEMVGCHYPTSSLPQYYAAMNTADYLAGAVCGACVEVTNSQNGQKLTVLIADECPEASNQQWCYTGSHHIDLIEPAYRALNANNNPPITWRYVPCAPQGAIQYYFDKAVKQGYLAVSPMSHRHRIKKMEVQTPAGTWIELKRSYYNMWETTTQLGPGPYNFRVTDIHNHMLQDNGIEMKAAQVVNGAGQFDTCN